jgi:outer membrane immunogenic protein
MVAPLPVFSWTGFYMGVNAGGAWNPGDESISTVGLVAPNNVIYTGGSANNSAFSVGVTAGYNMQFGSFVVGVEGDLDYLYRDRRASAGFPAPVVYPGFFVSDRTDFAVSRSGGDNWFGTLRGRLGFAFDRALVFATGGLAFGGSMGSVGVTQRDYYEINAGVFNVTGVRSLAGPTSSDRNIGWALGGGVEYMIGQATSVKLEYLHVDLGTRSQTFTTLASAGAPPFGPPAGATMTAGNTITVKQKNSFDLMRVGVNFRF